MSIGHRRHKWGKKFDRDIMKNCPEPFAVFSLGSLRGGDITRHIISKTINK